MRKHARGGQGFALLKDNSQIRLVLDSFYEAPAGKQLAADLQTFLDRAWPDRDLGSGHLMWFGYPAPGIGVKAAAAKSFSLLTPPFVGPLPWVEGGFNKSGVADPARFPLREASFDYAVISHVVEYLDDPLSFVEELWRALSPGARVVFLFPTGRWPWAGLAADLRVEMKKTPPKAFSTFLRQNGFSLKQMSGLLHGFPGSLADPPKMSGVVKKISRGHGLALAGFYVLEAEKRIGGEAVKAKRAPLRTAPANPITS